MDLEHGCDFLFQVRMLLCLPHVLTVEKFHLASCAVYRHKLRLRAILDHLVGLFDLGDHLADALVPADHVCLCRVLLTEYASASRHLPRID